MEVSIFDDCYHDLIGEIIKQAVSDYEYSIRAIKRYKEKDPRMYTEFDIKYLREVTLMKVDCELFFLGPWCYSLSNNMDGSYLMNKCRVRCGLKELPLSSKAYTERRKLLYKFLEALERKQWWGNRVKKKYWGSLVKPDYIQ